MADNNTSTPEPQDELCAMIPKSMLVAARDEYLARTQFPYAYNVDGAQMAAVAIDQLIQQFFPENANPSDPE
jgi:hypothetical protein